MGISGGCGGGQNMELLNCFGITSITLGVDYSDLNPILRVDRLCTEILVYNISRFTSYL